MDEHESYCATPATAPATAPAAAPAAEQAAAFEGPFAECVLCREPTEYPASVKGAPLCPVCAWQEAQRSACSG